MSAILLRAMRSPFACLGQSQSFELAGTPAQNNKADRREDAANPASWRTACTLAARWARVNLPGGKRQASRWFRLEDEQGGPGGLTIKERESVLRPY